MLNINIISKVNNILQKGGMPLYSNPHAPYELPNELTIKIFEYLNIKQLLLLLYDDDTKFNAIDAIKQKLLHSKLDINDLVLLYNNRLLNKIIIMFILKELNKPSVSLLFVQDVYMNINNKGLKNKIIQMINNIYSSMFDIIPSTITDLYTSMPVDINLIKISYIRIYRIVQAFFDKYPEGIIGKEFYQTNPGTSYKFTIDFKKPEYTKTYIIDPGYSNNDCYISTPDYIWQILEECTSLILFNKLFELINNSFEYSYVLDKLTLIAVLHSPRTNTTESVTISQKIASF
jgi:hypothetical protein